MISSKKRIEKALNHECVGRVPIGFESTPEAESKLLEYLNLKDREDLLKRVGCDYRLVFPKYIGPKELKSLYDWNEEGIDVFGTVRKIVKNKYGSYSEIVSFPLREMEDPEQIANYNWPKIDWFEFENIKNQIEKINSNEEYWISLVSTGVFEQAWYMRGFDKFLMDLIINPEIAKLIMDRIFQFVCELTVQSIEAVKGKIDMVMTGDDIGGQEGLLISKDLWAELVKPYLKKFCDIYHSYGVKVYYHSCGSIGSLIDELIDSGVDVLNPLQFSAKDFPKPDVLKRLYGDKLCFQGGIDVQKLLPFGSVQEIKKQTIYLIETLGKDGGLILETSHDIQPDVEPQKIMAFYDTALNYKYR